MAEKSIIWDLISNDRSSATNNKVGSSFEKLDRHTSNLGATFGRVAGYAKYMGAAVGAAGTFAVVSGVKTLASLETTQVGFTTLLGSAKKANDYITWMKKFAAATPFNLAGLTDSARLLLGVGVSASQTKVILQDFGDTAGAVGMDAQHFSMAMLAVSQSISAGHIKLGDMNQLMNDGIPIWKLLSEAMGKPVPKIQAMISKGKLLSTDVMPKLLAVMHKDYGGAMAAQSETLTGLWSTLTDTINLGMADALRPLEGMMKGGLKTGISVFGSALAGLPKLMHDVQGAAKGMHLGGLAGDLFGDAKHIEQVASNWADPIINGLRSGIQSGDWSLFWPMIQGKIFAGAGAAGSGSITIAAKLGGMFEHVDWMKVGESVGRQAFPFAVGFVTTLLDGVVSAFRHHPIETVLGILSVIPIGRVAGLLSKGLKPGILKGVLDTLGWAGKKLEGPVWGFVKWVLRRFGEGFVHAAPELSAFTKDMIETGILKVLYRAEGVSKGVGHIFTVIGQAPGRLVGKVAELMYKAGQAVVTGFVRGIRGMIPAVVGAAASVAASVPGEVKKLLHIHSPSKVMEILGGHTMQGYINGIRGKKKEMHSALEEIKGELSKDIGKWNTVYDRHKQKLADLKSAYAGLKSSVRDAFAGTSIADRGSDMAGVLGSFSSDIAKSRASSAALKRLKKLGLRTDLLTQLAQGGPGALGLEQSILGSGRGGIAKLNQDQKTLIGLGNSAGKTVADATYAKAIHDEARETAALAKVNRELAKALRDVVHALRQPSKVDSAKLRAELYKILKQGGHLAGTA